MTRSFTCIICPNGCEITAEYEGDTVYAVQGAACPKGDAYVRQELTDPQRNIATSVLVEGGELPLGQRAAQPPHPQEGDLSGDGGHQHRPAPGPHRRRAGGPWPTCAAWAPM